MRLQPGKRAIWVRALMERGGKRSATPLWVSFHAERRIESAVAAESSAGALQIADAPLLWRGG